MSQKIYTFSVSEREPKTIELVDKIKQECKASGKSFSFVVLAALKKAGEANDSV
jgi:putative heme iron utilization protein